MSARSRSKGSAGEREIVMCIRACGWDAERNLEQTRDGGADIVFKAGSVFWICEVKRHKRVYPVHKRAAWEQVTQAWKESDLEPRRRVVFHRDDGKPWRAIYAVQDQMLHAHFEDWHRHARNLRLRIERTKTNVIDGIY